MFSPQAQTGAPCLSFDVLRDSLGEGRGDYPMTAYLVAGTQSEKAKQNHIIVMKMSQLGKTVEENEGLQSNFSSLTCHSGSGKRIKECLFFCDFGVLV